jgi:hypothetical protein
MLRLLVLVVMEAFLVVEAAAKALLQMALILVLVVMALMV